MSTLSILMHGCGGGGSSGGNAMTTAIQNLTTDPDGNTTVITFESDAGLALATTANFEADGGQSAQTVNVVGDVVTIVWDDRVTPSHQVRATGLSGVSTAFHAVTTSNGNAPTFTITDAVQTPGLGGDTIEVTFSGPRVVASDAEDLGNWTLTIDGQSIDLTGSTLDFDPMTQVLDVTLGGAGNLHADFSLSANGLRSVADVLVSATPVDGVAAGDAVAPTLVSAVQNLSEDEYGRVVDFTFSEVMDPVFSTNLSQFVPSSSDIATSAELVSGSEEIIRVSFSGPVVPGVETVSLSDIVDAHGNAFPDGAQVIAQPSPVANAFDGTPAAVTVEDEMNDYISIVTTQAFDADSAVDPANWDLVVDGNTIDLSTQTLDYDFLTKTLVITLDFDMHNGDPFTVTALNVLDVDGESFGMADSGLVAGDAVGPTVLSVTQNRVASRSGRKLDVRFSEALDQTSAETLANWTISGIQNVLSAQLLQVPGLDTVRLTFDEVVVPPDENLTVDNIQDLAGNAMAAPAIALPIGSTDSNSPHLNQYLATAVEGANNDSVVVTFNDDMVIYEVEDPANWLIESPVGTPLDTTGVTVSYNDTTSTGSLTFDNGLNLTRDDDFQVSFVNARDLAGNVITSTVYTGTVTSEMTPPAVHSVHRDGFATDELVVYFTEPCQFLDDLYSVGNPDGTRYVLRTSGGVLRGLATAATVLDDGLGVRLSFGVVIAASDTLDVLGLADLAGNVMFPALVLPTVAEDATEPALDIGQSVLTSVSGERNDVITVKFDRPMSPWRLLAPSNYSITNGSLVDLDDARFSFDGTDTVTIELGDADENDLKTGVAYDLSIDEVRSAQGALRTLPDTEIGIPAGGDATAPNVLNGKVHLDPVVANALLIEVNEAVDATAAMTFANYDYDSGNLAQAVTVLGPRMLRVEFAVQPTAGNNLDVTVTDLAGNVSGTITRAVTAADSTGPLIAGITGVITPGYGGDYVTIAFNEPVSNASATDTANYTVQSGVTSLVLTNALVTYTSSTHTVTIHLPDGQELDAGAMVTITVQGVADFSGNAMPNPVQTSVAVLGDNTAPSFAAAFVNYRENASGTTIDILFNEDVDQAYVASTMNWTASGGQAVQSVTMLERNHARLVLASALTTTQTLQMTGVEDLAQNASGLITIDPTE